MSCKPGVDEQLFPFKGKALFRMYMRSEPTKYGIKIWTATDCDSAYIINMQVYVGKALNVIR